MIRRLAPLLIAFGLLTALPAAGAAASQFPPGYEGYHTYDEMVTEIHDIAAAHPDIVALSVIGQSYEGRDLWAVKISDNVNTDENEPEVVFTALTHAREHLTVEQALALIHWLVDGYGQPGNERTDAIVNSTVIWVLPELNPDGGEFDIKGGHFHGWRKNRQPTPGSTSIGTDINRNYGYHWGCCGGSSADPASYLYRGPAAWSTPEARAERSFFASRVIGGQQQIRMVLNLHSHAERIIYPYGYTTTPVPPDMVRRDHRIMAAIAGGMADRNGYRPSQASHWYIMSGTANDWIYHRYRIPSFTMELGPSASVHHFNLPSDQIGPETEVNKDALLWFLEQAPCPSAVIGDTCGTRPSSAPAPAVAAWQMRPSMDLRGSLPI